MKVFVIALLMSLVAAVNCQIAELLPCVEDSLSDPSNQVIVSRLLADCTDLMSAGAQFQELCCNRGACFTAFKLLFEICHIDIDEAILYNCTVPEAVESRAIVTMDTALNQGICHSRCVEEQTIINDVQQFSGYPNWLMAYSSFFLSEDGRNGLNCLSRNSTNSCELPRSCPSDFSPLMDCKRGCEIRLRGIESGCLQNCRAECQAECLDSFLPGLGCEVERFPAPCRALCSAVQCNIGCSEGSETSLSFEGLQDLNGGTPPHPTLPPTVTHINNTLYRVDVETVLPQVSANLSSLASQIIGYCTVVIKVEGEDSMERFYVLDDTNEVELGDFACQIVNISYAIATALAGVSNFSSPLTVAVINIEAESFPSQPEVVNVTVEQDNRVGFFQQHIVHVSWERPTGIQHLEEYQISLTTGLPICGTNININLYNLTATSYTFQAPTPFTGDGESDLGIRTPPVTRCTYVLTFEALPRNIDAGDGPFVMEFSTGEYDVPNGGDLSLTCDVVYNQRSDSYSVTLGLELNSMFTPAVIEAIRNLQIDRVETDSDGEIVPNSRMILGRTLDINATVLNYEYPDTILPLAEPVEFHKYTVTVVWRSSVPRRAILTPDIQAHCLTQRLVFGPPLPVQHENVDTRDVTVSARGPGEHWVTVNFDFSYDSDTRGVPKPFVLWLADEPASNCTVGSVTRDAIDETQRNGTITRRFLAPVSEDNVIYFFQIHVQTELFRSSWSDAINGNISTRPRTLGDDDYDVTRFTYSTSTTNMGELEVVVDIEVTHRIQSEGILAEVELCISEQELEGAESLMCPEESSETFTASASGMDTVENISHTIVLETLGIHLFIQVQGISLSTLRGNWSNPELIDIEDIPPPTNITSELISAERVTDSDGMESFMVMMTVNWDVATPTERIKRQIPVRKAGMNLTGYAVVIGFEPIEEPYGEVPMSGSSIQTLMGVDMKQAEISGSIAMETSDSLTDLYVQMRSSADNAFGSWSEAVLVAVNLSTTTVPGRSSDIPDTTPGSTPVANSTNEVLLQILVPIFVVLIILSMMVVLLILFCRWYRKHKEAGLMLKKNDAILILQRRNNIPDGIEIPNNNFLIYSENLDLQETIGQGQFGIVYKGHLYKDVARRVRVPVAVKTIKGFLEPDLVKSLLEEFIKMSSFDHPNVLMVTGVCLDGGPVPYVVMPFMFNGDLLSYLKKESGRLVVPPDFELDDGTMKDIRTKLMDICLQIAKGMEYLANRRVVHRDLACRNCMIDLNFVIKVADFGLSETIDPTREYFRQENSNTIKLPFKWLSPESLREGVFSEKTDVWAFGVTCWEVYSGGMRPYVGVNPADLVWMLEEGHRMEKPPNQALTDEEFEMMKNCWEKKPEDRPTFTDLVAVLSLAMESMAGYVSINESGSIV